MYWKGQHAVNINAMSQRQKGKEMEKENKMGQEKKVQIKVMIKKIKNKVWLFLKKIYTKLPEKMKVHIRKLKPKEKIRGEYKGSDQAEEMPVLKVSPNRNWIRLFWVLLVISIILGIYNNFTSVVRSQLKKKL